MSGASRKRVVRVAAWRKSAVLLPGVGLGWGGQLCCADLSCLRRPWLWPCRAPWAPPNLEQPSGCG